MSQRVAFITQRDYEPEKLLASIRRAVDLSGFDLASVRDKKVLLKPNMLGAYPPWMGITTHPAFVKAAAEIFISSGAMVSIGDSPNGVYPPQRVWEITGMRDVCLSSGAAEAQFEASGSCERGGFRLARAVFDADIVVNLPKFKTHGLTVMTLSVKNLFGCMNGMQKTALHRENHDRTLFGEAMVKIAEAVKPALNIIDGIVAMEGSGPSAGKLVEMGVIVAGTDMHAVDAACCEFVGLAPLDMDTLAAAKQMGIWDEHLKIEHVGDSFDALRPKSFALPSTYTRGIRDWWITRFAIERIWNGLSAQPAIDADLCEECLLCTKACPVDAIPVVDPSIAPAIDEEKCIQCFCCHEVCPHHAIYLKESFLLRLARIFVNRAQRK